MIWIWVIGFVICFLLACVRLYFKEDKEKGDRFLVLFNSVLIFLYASGFNGFTKELGSWSQLRELGIELSVNSGDNYGGSNLVPASWVPNIFANQTAIWPDVRLINENRILKAENRKLRESLENLTPTDYGDLNQRIRELERENERLKKQLAGISHSPGDEALQNIERERDLAWLQLKTLLARVEESNKRVSDYRQLISEAPEVRRQETRYYSVLTTDFKGRGGDKYVELVRVILNTPIDTSLPE